MSTPPPTSESSYTHVTAALSDSWQCHYPLIDLTISDHLITPSSESVAPSPTTPNPPLSMSSLQSAASSPSMVTYSSSVSSPSSQDSFATAPSSPRIWSCKFQEDEDGTSNQAAHAARSQSHWREDHIDRQLSLETRVRRARIPDLPSYPVKTSRTVPGQLQAIQWMTADGQARFKRKEATVLASWGVKPEYQDSCILIPQLWDGVNPRDIMIDFGLESCPYDQLPRLVSVVSHAGALLIADTIFRSFRWLTMRCLGPVQPRDSQTRHSQEVAWSSTISLAAVPSGHTRAHTNAITAFALHRVMLCMKMGASTRRDTDVRS